MLLRRGPDYSVYGESSYRSTALISSFNKLFEVLVGHRLKGWWVDQVLFQNYRVAVKGMSHASIVSWFYRRVEPNHWRTRINALWPSLMWLSHSTRYGLMACSDSYRIAELMVGPGDSSTTAASNPKSLVACLWTTSIYCKLGKDCVSLCMRFLAFSLGRKIKILND